MSAVTTPNAPSTAHPMRNYVQSQLQNGADLETLVAELGKSGVEEKTAHQLISSVSQDLTRQPIHPTSGTSSVQLAILTALATSVVSGAIWAGVVLLTGWELGLMAWFVGGAVGYAVLLASKGGTSSAHQVIAVVGSVLGIIFGRYVTFYIFVKEYVSAEMGADAAAELSLFSPVFFSQFLLASVELFAVWDIVWIILACVTAWRVTSPASRQKSASLPRLQARS